MLFSNNIRIDVLHIREISLILTILILYYILHDLAYEEGILQITRRLYTLFRSPFTYDECMVRIYRRISIVLLNK